MGDLMNGWLLKYSWTCSVSNASQVSDVVIHPFLNLYPTDHTDVRFTLLRFTVRFTLFIKDVDIIAAIPELSDVIPRFGRFHLYWCLFLATTGFTMAGRGFDKLWQCATHMFDGHAYSRALLLQTLTAQVIVIIPLQTTGARDSIWWSSSKSNLVWNDNWNVLKWLVMRYWNLKYNSPMSWISCTR